MWTKLQVPLDQLGNKNQKLGKFDDWDKLK